jgi:SAM-dependent methyltransferase
MPPPIDEAKLHAFIGKMLGDLGGAMSVPTARIGIRLGLFEALAASPANARELASRAGGLHERYVREWALAQAANGYVDYDPVAETFALSPEQAMVFAVADSPVNLTGAFDLVAAMIEAARRHAQDHGLAENVRFEVAAAKEIPENGFDLVTMYDCLHDMGDPRGCAVHMRNILKPGGTWMIVEPIAGDTPAENMNPVGRLYYNASTMICVPTSLDQEVGEGLGAQAGEGRLTELIRAGGFASVRRATEGPFNMVLEAR